ncbi:MAG: hypothetical protein WBF42_06695 [Terracidiphilus sp.]
MSAGGLTVDAVRRRIEILDGLEAHGLEARCGVADAQSVDAERTRMEAELEEVYEGIRGEIRQGRRDALQGWLEGAGSAVAGSSRGLSYDWRDELTSGVLALKEPEGAKAVGAEMVFYQPTPVRHVMELIVRARITERDVVVDLGSGLGHVSLLVGILTGAQCMGIEIDGGYVACARECAARLVLSGRVTFAEDDARRAELGGGTVFYLYTPFKGAVLRDVLARLRGEAERRAICVCTLGPCAEAVARETWLIARGPVETERVTVFDQR